MIDLVSPTTCFALLLVSPGNLPTSFVIHGYPTIEQATQAKDDAKGLDDASVRIHRERYEASPQYAIDQAKAKQEKETEIAARLKRGCKADSWDTHQPISCQSTDLGSSGMSVISYSTYTPWNAKVIPEPCIKQD